MLSKSILTICAAAILSSCVSNKDTSKFVTYIQPINGIDGYQGISLYEDGRAQSYNMASLNYESFKIDGDKITLTGESFGNHQTIAFSDNFDIVIYNDNELVLRRNDLILDYFNENLLNRVKVVEGTLELSHESYAFIEGDKEYWVKDCTQKLYSEYDKLTGGVKNGKSINAKLKVVDLGKEQDGFAADYDGTYKVIGIISLTK